MRSFLLLAFVALGANAQEDPLSEHLVPPQVVMQKAVEVGITDEQRDAIRDAIDKAHEQSSEKQMALQVAVEALGQILHNHKIDEPKAIEGLDIVVDAERAVKQLHLQMLIQVNNILTATQRNTLRQFHVTQREQHDPRSMEKRLTAKVKRVQEGVQAKSQAGEQPFEVVKLMQRFPKLMELGKHAEAETVLDKALELLGEEDAPEEDAPEEAPEPPTSFKSTEELESEVAALRVEDVAWRKIEWKTCLLQGLKASQVEKKPIILWVFIDRPVDDKRC
ncbi:MAG: hypothetical protein L7V86_19050 [Verrucomicrobiales bacterium]|nr:hypothetical protein [Verrucomicrobiales bacterium]